MENLLIYLLKATALLSVFYLAYQFLLKKDTFFELNRKYLIAGVLGSAILPAIYFTKTIFVEAAPVNLAYPRGNFTSIAAAESPTDWWQIIGIAYLLVTAFFILRLCLQLISVFRIIASEKVRKENGIYYIETNENQLPFSFFNFVVFNAEKHSDKDLQLILRHEEIHARQLHSLDILLANFTQCILWFNPFAWLYKKSVEENLEFIADRAAVGAHQLKDYQHALVKVSVADLQPALTTHFYQSFIKKRILMLNKKSSKSSPAWKLSILFPVIFGFLLFFNVKTEARIIQKQPSEVPVTSEAISAHITKKTTKSELQEFKKEFAEHDVKLDFGHVKYSSAGILTRIDISVKDKNTGNKGSLNRRNPDGIEPIDILVAENGELSLGSATTIEVEGTATATSGNRKYRIIDHAFNLPQDEPLLILNGIPQKDRSKVESLSPSKIKNIKVLKGIKATALYGTRGRNGVIVVSTKSEDNQASKVEIRKNVTIVDSTRNPNGDIYAYEYGKKNKEIILRNSKGEKPLYIIDGEVKEEDFDLGQIQPKDIAAINVLKGNLATDEYGKKGENGVIEIHTKSESFMGKDQKVVKISEDMSDADLEAVKEKLKSLTGIELSIDNISRNNGVITSISLKSEQNGKQIGNANFQDTEGIPSIYVGLVDGKSVIWSTND